MYLFISVSQTSLPWFFKHWRIVEEKQMDVPTRFSLFDLDSTKSSLNPFRWKRQLIGHFALPRAVYSCPFECMSELAPSISLQKQQHSHFLLRLCAVPFCSNYICVLICTRSRVLFKNTRAVENNSAWF